MHFIILSEIHGWCGLLVLTKLCYIEQHQLFHAYYCFSLVKSCELGSLNHIVTRGGIYLGYNKLLDIAIGEESMAVKLMAEISEERGNERGGNQFQVVLGGVAVGQKFFLFCFVCFHYQLLYFVHISTVLCVLFSINLQ